MVRHDATPTPVPAQAPTSAPARASRPNASTTAARVRARAEVAERRRPTARSTLRKPPAPRLPVIAAAYSDEDSSQTWRTLDLSLGGVYLCGEPLLEVGHEMDLALWLPDRCSETEIVLRARVAWVNAPGSGQPQQRPTGMGLEFVEFDTGDDKVLANYLRALPRAVRHGTHHACGHPLLDEEDSEGLAGTSEDEHLAAPTPAQRLTTGQRVGPYRLLERLGGGYSGEVYLAEHQDSGQRVAVKRLAPQLSCDTHIGQQYAGILNIVTRLSHPNLVELCDHFAEGPDTFCVTQFVRGISTADALALLGAMEAPRAVGVTMQVCGALHAAHAAGVVHGDVRPQHVLLAAYPRGETVKLIDLGIGAALAQTPWGRRARAPSTNPYAAPELRRGSNLAVQTDIYAVGALLHALLTGAPPNTHSRRNTLIGTPPPIADITRRCLAADPAKRPHSIQEVHAALLDTCR